MSQKIATDRPIIRSSRFQFECPHCYYPQRYDLINLEKGVEFDAHVEAPCVGCGLTISFDMWWKTEKKSFLKRLKRAILRF